MSSSPERSPHSWRCECGLPGVRLRTESPSNPSGRAYYKCIPCDRVLGFCPCTTPGARTTLTCDCSQDGSEAGSPGLEDQVPRGVSILSANAHSFNPLNPDSGFDEDWDPNWSPGYMVSRFKARGKELGPWA
ncbi:hypothetical protein N7468_005400 [Penicillium chermesinum]|uniref:GRF-like zinc ribbon domain-containing protein n=1 Tax=Penicillium chermesinum TaxID=63820 RepID=A0A9W9NYZ9_9EURO|nr:uncharacterized protein N7468_005400 [Penicillium chermesinum]KAJ5232444.1 hypothetical protein N7468_005400 [Penicillium chermesinum]